MKKILIVEDSASQGQLLRRDFEEQNYEVFLTTTGFEAYRTLKDETPDLIILDYSLPDTNGIELCKHLKQDNRFRLIPTIMFSAENKLHHMMRAYEAGADYYVVKDDEGNRVLCLLAESLFRRRARAGVGFSLSA